MFLAWFIYLRLEENKHGRKDSAENPNSGKTSPRGPLPGCETQQKKIYTALLQYSTRFTAAIYNEQKKSNHLMLI